MSHTTSPDFNSILHKVDELTEQVRQEMEQRQQKRQLREKQTKPTTENDKSKDFLKKYSNLETTTLSSPTSGEVTKDQQERFVENMQCELKTVLAEILSFRSQREKLTARIYNI